MGKITLIILSGIIFGCSPIRGGLESEFTLSQDSKLPAWYPSLPDGVERKDVEIKLQFWTPPPLFDVYNTVFLVKKGWWTIYKATGEGEWHPEFWNWKNENWAARYMSRPSFYVVTIDGKTEVVSFPILGPVWEVSSESAVESVIEIDQ